MTFLQLLKLSKSHLFHIANIVVTIAAISQGFIGLNENSESEVLNIVP